MLKSLLLKNLILIEESVIDFKDGLTIVTGETGAGKTALIEALRLLLGERADSSKVRKGCEKASVIASFDPPHSIIPLLKEAGVDYEKEEELIIKREIRVYGKGRSFVCGQMVPGSFLQTLAPHLIDFVSQHAQVLLKNSDRQLSLLDQFCKIDLHPFQDAWREEKQLDQAYRALLISKESSKVRKNQLEAQKEELEEANIQEKEDENLFEEYTFLANVQELLIHASSTLSSLDEACAKCIDIEKNLDHMLRFDKSLEEAKTMSQEAHIQLSELTQTIQSFQGKLEDDPKRLTFLEERLKTLDRLKKKYGSDPSQCLITIEKKLSELENLNEKIVEIQEKLNLAKEKTTREAQKLRFSRTQGAKKLASHLTESLRELNIPQAEVTIALEPASRTITGEDSVIFYLQANKGEESVPVKESSSGGELSRLLFSLKLLLSNQVQTLVFDEIDANVGGETATIIGEKLKTLGKKRQILCVTHFPQVARQADHHLIVTKKETGGRTYSEITLLDECSKERELLRMLGGSLEALKTGP